MFLNELPLDQSGIIKRINSKKSIKERLHSFGLIRGVEIRPIKKSPLGCPRIYRCMNTTIAIRNNIAKQIEIL